MRDPSWPTQYELHIIKGLEDLARTRSFLAEVLYSDTDRYVREELLGHLSNAELNFRKALA